MVDMVDGIIQSPTIYNGTTDLVECSDINYNCNIIKQFKIIFWVDHSLYVLYCQEQCVHGGLLVSKHLDN